MCFIDFLADTIVGLYDTLLIAVLQIDVCCDSIQIKGTLFISLLKFTAMVFMLIALVFFYMRACSRFMAFASQS